MGVLSFKLLLKIINVGPISKRNAGKQMYKSLLALCVFACTETPQNAAR